jgi:RNA polymerase sigma-70 factor (ECF subfamily)
VDRHNDIAHRFDGGLLPDDDGAVAQILGGDRDKFRLLVERHEKAVYGMGMSFFRNADDARDFTQDVFLKAFRSLGSFQGRSRFSTWLYRIAYNTALNMKERRKEYRSLSEEEEIRDDETPERGAIRQAVCLAVRQAVSELPERYRICIDLYFFYERSYEEIEKITGMPVNTIKSHVFRAKKLLREKLQGYIEGGM